MQSRMSRNFVQLFDLSSGVWAPVIGLWCGSTSGDALALSYTPPVSEPEFAPTPANAYSFSRVKCFHQCPLRYRLRYLEGRKESFRSIESFLGTTVHEVLEWLYAERMRGASPDEPALLGVFAARWSAGFDETVALIRVDDHEDNHLRLGREMLSRFFNGTFARDRSVTIALEQRLAATLASSVVLTGFADRVGRTDGGRLFVVDYKTSKAAGNASDFSEGVQAPLYAACALGHHGEREALAGYHYLRHGFTRWQKVEEARAQELFGKFLALVREIELTGEFPPRPGALCAWCGYNACCPAAEVPESLSGGLRKAEALGGGPPGPGGDGRR
jgi:putative RecB family exonuclease